MHAEHLRRLTYDVEEAGDGLEALAKAVANHPTIVVTESPLSGISGVELCRMLRSEPLTRTVPVIVLAATAGHRWAERQDGRRQRRAGQAPYVGGPCVRNPRAPRKRSDA